MGLKFRFLLFRIQATKILTSRRIERYFVLEWPSVIKIALLSSSVEKIMSLPPPTVGSKSFSVIEMSSVHKFHYLNNVVGRDSMLGKSSINQTINLLLYFFSKEDRMW